MLINICFFCRWLTSLKLYWSFYRRFCRIYFWFWFRFRFFVIFILILFVMNWWYLHRSVAYCTIRSRSWCSVCIRNRYYTFIFTSLFTFTLFIICIYIFVAIFYSRLYYFTWSRIAILFSCFFIKWFLFWIIQILLTHIYMFIYVYSFSSSSLKPCILFTLKETVLSYMWSFFVWWFISILKFINFMYFYLIFYLHDIVFTIAIIDYFNDLI